ncbi:uncharacterized protein LOC127853294 [Dreissena polymorpha]|uniref:Roc domain-containing protein n=1 Tax=Dreissena polymorpha TaxID=45954 RepID=A0A9D4CE60_DREPO|nr:uncharacterized protein LOC127853294 [Dreissena polymorpha]KAH3723528.1 hypothetical protein DPMN_049318 [Dreissena polymorpha]
MASLADVYKDKERTNWLKAWLAIDIAKSGLEHLADNEAQNFHRLIYSHVGSSCTSCTTANVQHKKPCPRKICDQVYQKIINEHRYNSLSWKNTSAQLWQTNYWEIAKCYFPPDGYAATSSIRDTDFNGVISFMLNCKRFDSSMSFPITTGKPTTRTSACLLYKAREIGKAVRHSSVMKVTDVELLDYFTTLSNLLNDSCYLIGDSDAQKAVKELEELKKDTLLLTTAEMICLLEAVDATLKKRLKDVVDTSLNELRDNTALCIDEIKDYIDTWNQSTETSYKKSCEDKLPKDVQQLDEKATTLFYKALKHGKEQVNNIRLMVVGMFGVGKTSLVNNLIWEFRNKTHTKQPLSTEGIDIHRCKLMTDGDWCLDTELIRVKFGDRIEKVVSKNTVTATEDHETFKERIALHKGDEILQHGIKVAKRKLETTSLDESTNEITTSLDESTNEITVSVWDFAGQTLYYSTHQFFLNERSIYVVVMDMTRSLKDIVSKSDGIGIWCGLVDSCTYLDIFKFWLNAIHMNSDYQSGERTIKPNVILVGTRKDKMKGSAEEKEENMNLYFDNALCSFDKHSPIFNHIYKNRFLVNNLCPEDSAFAELRKEIISLATKQDYWDEEYPVRWIHMEQTLDKMRDKKRQIVKMKDVEKEDLENLHPLGIEELTLFLELQHKQGNIIFFNSGALKDFVVLAPQWIIEAFKCFIPHNQKIEATVLKDWEEYKQYAILKPNVLDEVMKNSPPYIHEYRSAVINYMEYLNVIAKPLTSEEGITGIPLDFHIVPCLLSRAPPPLHIFTSPPDKPQTPVLAFVFCGKFLPPSFFHRLVAVCIRAWPICQERGQYCLFNGLAIFTLNDTYTLRIWYMDYIIYARIVCCSENEQLDNFIWLFQEVRRKLKKSLKDFFYQSSSVFEECIQCPDMKVSLHNEGLFIVKKFKYTNAIACRVCNPHAVTRSNAMKHWFKEKLDRIETDDD